MGMYEGNPCRHCVTPKRHPGCHAECPEYAEWRANYNDVKARHDEEVKNDLLVDDFVVAGQRKRERIVNRHRYRG